MFIALKRSPNRRTPFVRPRMVALNVVPASEPLMPWAAKVARTATPSSNGMFSAFIDAAALLVSASENCCTDALARMFALTSTSETLTRFSMFSVASDEVRPIADCASASRDVAVARSNIPA